MISAEEVLSYTMGLHYDSWDTESTIPMYVRRVEEYTLEWIQVKEVLVDEYVVDEGKVVEYLGLDWETMPPIVLGKKYASGYGVVDGNHRVKVCERLGEEYVRAYIPVDKPKILYHVSPCLEMIPEFVPRVPDEVMVGEDCREPRICVADSLEGCFSSAPWGGNQLEHTLWNDEIDDIERVFRVYEFDTSGILSGHLVTPEELHRHAWVGDALLKGEHWITVEEPYVRTYLICVTGWDYKRLDDGEEYSDVWDEYSDVWDDTCTTVVESLEYVSVGV